MRSSSKASKVVDGSVSSKQVSIKKHFAEDTYLNLEAEEFKEVGSSSGYITISNHDPRKTDNDLSSLSANDKSNTRSNRSPSLGKQFMKGKDRMLLLKDSDDNVNSASFIMGREFDSKFDLWKVAPVKKNASLRPEEAKHHYNKVAGSSGKTKKYKGSSRSPSKIDPDQSDTMSIRSSEGSSVSSKGERAIKTLAVLPSFLTRGNRLL